MSKQKNLESQLASRMQQDNDIPRWEKNYKFNRPTNSMEFDFAWPEYKVAIEVDGGQWSQNTGHNSGAGVERDSRKSNYAALQGWLLLRFVTDHIEKQLDQYTIPTIREALSQRGASLIDYETKLTKLFAEAKELA